MLGWCVETTLIAAGLAALVVLVSRSRRLTAEARHALWVVALVKFLVPPLIAWPWAWGEFTPTLAPAVAPVVAPLETPAAPPPGPTVAPKPEMNVVSASLTPEPESPVPPELAAIPESPPDPIPLADSEPAPPSVVDVPAVAPVPEVVESHPEPIPPAPVAASPPAFPTFRVDWRVALAAIWLIGSVMVAVRGAVRVLRFRRALRHAVPAPGWVVAEVAAVASRLGVRRLPSSVVVEGLPTPLLWCLGRPRLVLPGGLDQMAPAARSGLFAHELAHLRRWDHWVVRLELVAGLVWWWNPVFRFTTRRLRAEAEAACDARVVSAFPEHRFAYAEALVQVCAANARPAPPLPALGIGGAWAARSLEARLTMILRDPIRSPSRWLPLATLALLAVAVPSWTLGQQEPTKPTDPPRVKVQKPDVPPQAETTKPVAPVPPAESSSIPPSIVKPPVLAVGINPPTSDLPAQSWTLEQIIGGTTTRREPTRSLAFRQVIAGRTTASNGPSQVQVQTADLVLGRRSQHDPERLPAPGEPGYPNLRTKGDHLGGLFRADILTAQAAAPGAVGSPEWSRQFATITGRNTMIFQTNSTVSGPIPIRWSHRFSTDALNVDRFDLASLLTVQLSRDSAPGGDPFGFNPLGLRIPPEHLLDLTGPTRLIFGNNDLLAQLVGVESINNVEVARVAWTATSSNQYETHGLCWIAPRLNHALIRLEATGNRLDGKTGRLTWRQEPSGFRQIDDLWLPDRVDYMATILDDKAQVTDSLELIATFEDYRINPDLPATTFNPKLAIGALDPSSGNFTAVPPEVPLGLADRLKQAIAASPFGIPRVEAISAPASSSTKVTQAKTVPQMSSPEQPPPPPGNEDSAALIWRTLGLVLAPVDLKEVTLASPQLRGGLLVQKVQADSAAGRASLRKGDILIGLMAGPRGFETITADNLVSILHQPEVNESPLLPFFIVRDQIVQTGVMRSHANIAPVGKIRAQAVPEATDVSPQSTKTTKPAIASPNKPASPEEKPAQGRFQFAFKAAQPPASANPATAPVQPTGGSKPPAAGEKPGWGEFRGQFTAGKGLEFSGDMSLLAVAWRALCASSLTQAETKRDQLKAAAGKSGLAPADLARAQAELEFAEAGIVAQKAELAQIDAITASPKDATAGRIPIAMIQTTRAVQVAHVAKAEAEIKLAIAGGDPSPAHPGANPTTRPAARTLEDRIAAARTTLATTLAEQAKFEAELVKVQAETESILAAQRPGPAPSPADLPPGAAVVLPSPEAEQDYLATVALNAYLKQNPPQGKTPTVVTRARETEGRKPSPTYQEEVAATQALITKLETGLNRQLDQLISTDRAQGVPPAEPNKPSGTLVVRRDDQLAELQLAEAHRDAVKVVANRKAGLAQRNAIPQREADEAQSALDYAEAGVTRQKAKLAEADMALSAQVTREPARPAAPARGELVVLQARRNAQAAELRRVEAARARAGIEYKNSESLLKKNSVSQREVDLYRATHLGAMAEVDRERAKLAEADAVLAEANNSPGTNQDSGRTANNSSMILSDYRDLAEMAEVQVQSKRIQLRIEEVQFNHAKAMMEARRPLANEGRITKVEWESTQEAADTQESMVKTKQNEVLEAELRLKQTKRRAEFEETRVKRLAERAKDRLDWSRQMVQKGYVSSGSFAADRDAYDDLMLQLDPSYKPAPEPVVDPKKNREMLARRTDLKMQLLTAEADLAQAERDVKNREKAPIGVEAIRKRVDDPKRQLDEIDLPERDQESPAPSQPRSKFETPGRR